MSVPSGPPFRQVSWLAVRTCYSRQQRTEGREGALRSVIAFGVAPRRRLQAPCTPSRSRLPRRRSRPPPATPRWPAAALAALPAAASPPPRRQPERRQSRQPLLLLLLLHRQRSRQITSASRQATLEWSTWWGACICIDTCLRPEQPRRRSHRQLNRSAAGMPSRSSLPRLLEASAAR